MAECEHIASGQFPAPGVPGATFVPGVEEVPEGYEVSWENNRNLPNPAPVRLLHGKSAYQLAVEAGYGGTEVEFAAEMADAAVAKAKAEAAAEAAGKSETNAAAAADAAEQSEKNAKDSEEAARQAAGEAEQLAQAAAGSAGAASLSKQNAAASEQAAEDAAKEAENRAAAAGNAAGAAARSEANAKTSEENAARSEAEAKKNAQQAKGLVLTGPAKAGQLIVVTEVDAEGKPTKWEPVDRTHYETDPVTGEIFPETVVSADTALPLLNLVAGETYTVVWNGTEYACTAESVTAKGITAVFIGNAAAIGGENSGIPFVIIDIPAQGGAMCAAMDGSTSATVRIIGTIPSFVKKLDNKFIDAEWMATTYIEDVEVVAESELEKHSWQGDVGVSFTLPSDLDLNAIASIQHGDECTVKWNGTSYKVAAVDPAIISDGVASGYLLLGNGSLAGGGVAIGTNYPFGILTDCENVMYIVGSDEEATSATLAIVHHKTAFNKLPSEFLPPMVPVIQSASAGQIARIKTVDENGRPAEWEIVDPADALILTSPNGTKYKLTVADDGTPSTEAVTT